MAEAARKRKTRACESSFERSFHDGQARVTRAAARRMKRQRRLVSNHENPEHILAGASQAHFLRMEETRVRNAENQKNACWLKAQAKKSNAGKRTASYASKQRTDRDTFFEEIDRPLSFICGSCGELANARTMKIHQIDSKHAMFRVLSIGLEDDGLVPEAVVHHTNSKSVPFCEPCLTSLRRNKKPRFCAASGFRLRAVPPELAVLNYMEARMVGLGICFTTCYNLAGDGQEGSKGNAINFWNDACKIAASLPRPVTKCGVVRVKCEGDVDSSRLFSVRPHLIRLALLWLRQNNPLYGDVSISEEVLKDLESSADALDLPTLEVDSKRDGDSTVSDGSIHVDRDELPSSLEDVHACNEVFHMETGDTSSNTETANILQSLNVEVAGPTTPINEYTTKTMMQCCFPTLFPDGQGGLFPVHGENRTYSYELASYCAHLLAWHDRRFVMHRNFKFFCLNLIQRRQIDGLTRRVHTKPTETGNTDTTARSSDDVGTRAKHILKELKPYFKVVRGSGLYWTDVRDQLMALIGNDVLPSPFPTFFFTLSAADTVWPDFFCACNPSLTLNDAARLSSKERRRYLNENPDIASRHFYRRFKSFFDNIICGQEKPLGEIADYFWRVEFQKRGSPHVHGLLWVRDAPDVMKLSKTLEGQRELQMYVDRFISADGLPHRATSACRCGLCKQLRKEPSLDILGLRPPSSDASPPVAECDLAHVVRRVQQHVCFANSSCRAKTGQCRFEFPKPIHSSTTVSVDTAKNGALKLHVNCRRTDSNTNNYNGTLLSTWRANMDIKLVGNAYGAAEYTAAYVSKSEPDTTKFRDLICGALAKCPDNAEHHDVLRRVSNATLAAREVSAQEALWILQNRLPMYGKSRNVLNVKTTRHSKRYYRVDPETCRQELTGITVEEREEIKLDRLEAAYMARPHSFSDLSYKSFCENYESTKDPPSPAQRLERWPRLDGNGYIKARQQPQAIAKTPRWKADASNADYCFSELFLRVPWRSIDELPESDDECLTAFHSLQTCISRQAQHQIDLDLDRQHQLQLLSDSREDNSIRLPATEWEISDSTDPVTLPSANTPAVAVSVKSLGTYSAEDLARADSFIAAVVKPFMKARKDPQLAGLPTTPRQAKCYLYPICLADQNMNHDQWNAFAVCMQQSRYRRDCQRNHSDCKPMTMILNGEGGCGKSWLIRHIVKDIHHIFGDSSISTRYSRRVLVIAHHGTAAFNIKGSTICSALALPRMTGRGYDKTYEPLASTTSGSSKLRTLQERYHSIHMVIIDEYSVVSCGMLHWIDQRMREIWPSERHLPFGGRDVILAGDLGQLSPVTPSALSTPLEQLHNHSQREGRKLWLAIKNVCNLTSQTRGHADPEWFAALGRLRRMEETDADRALFNTRHGARLSPSAETNFIAYTNDDVDSANRMYVQQQLNHVYHLDAVHEIDYIGHTADRHPDSDARAIADLLEQAQVPNRSRDRILRTSIDLAIGAPVCLTVNLEQSAGLCNGTKCRVYDFMPKPNSVPTILVEVLDKYLGPSFLNTKPNIVPITPHKLSWTTPGLHMRTRRVGLPLRLGYAMTIHKVQGLTCSSLVFDPTGIPTSAFAYVGLSRVRHRENISLTRELHITNSHVQTHTKSNLIEEWKRLDNLHSIGMHARVGLVARYQDLAELENASRRMPLTTQAVQVPPQGHAHSLQVDADLFASD